VAAHDPVALAEIDLYGELMIAAAATPFERLPADLIDEVLRVAHGPEQRPGPGQRHDGQRHEGRHDGQRHDPRPGRECEHRAGRRSDLGEGHVPAQGGSAEG
jgi:hypothetical protein